MLDEVASDRVPPNCSSEWSVWRGVQQWSCSRRANKAASQALRDGRPQAGMTPRWQQEPCTGAPCRGELRRAARRPGQAAEKKMQLPLAATSLRRCILARSTAFALAWLQRRESSEHLRCREAVAVAAVSEMTSHLRSYIESELRALPRVLPGYCYPSPRLSTPATRGRHVNGVSSERSVPSEPRRLPRTHRRRPPPPPTAAAYRRWSALLQAWRMCQQS